MGFNIEAIFDINPKIIGLSFRGIEVLDIELLNDYIKNNKIDLAILCVPEFQAESIYTVLKDRVIGIWNFCNSRFSIY